MRAGGGMVGWLALVAVWLVLPRSWTRPRRAVVAAGWRLMLAGFGLRARLHGRIERGDGVLYVANHVSWTDIPLLGAVLDAPFVAKADVRGWPVVGALTQAYGCLFVEREARGRAGEQAAAVGAHLEDGQRLVLFPEGTTGEGDTVLPFRSSLFALMGQGARVVQPITLRYAAPDGRPLDAEGRASVAWLGEETLGPHVARLVRQGGARVDIWFEAPIVLADAVGQRPDRKALARAAQAAISARLAATRAA